ncbi:MAG: Gfo/Idh/MocA family oxidoreductase, partial [Pseudomonadota bacterium]
MIRLLLAGAGTIGRRHLGFIQEHPGLTLAGLVDPSPDHRALANAPGFASLEEVNVAADGIVIATPTETHAPLTRAAAARGWHVLVEKPLAETLEEADAMIAAAEASGVHLLVGHHRRHHPHVARLKAALDEGAIGRPLTAALVWLMKKPDAYFEPAWRAGMNGAPVKQNLIHEVDTLRWLFGEVVDVAGFGGNPVRGAGRTESGGAVLRFESGCIVTVAFADTTPTPWGFEAGTGESPAIPHAGQSCLWIAGTEGGIEFPTLRLWSGAASWHEPIASTQLDVPPGIPLLRQLDHFSQVITGTATPLVSGREGRATLAATLAIEAATLPAGIAA